MSRPGRDPLPSASAHAGTKRRVLHLAPFLWSGAGKAITSLVDLQRTQYRVSLVTTPPSDELRNWAEYERQLARAKVPHQHIDLFHRDAATFWASVEAVRAHLVATKPHIVHAHAGVPTAVALLARERLSRQVLVVSQVHSWGVGRPAWMNTMDLWAHRQADAVVCSARSYEGLLRRAGVVRDRLHLVPWGVTGAEVVAQAGEPRRASRRRAHVQAAPAGGRPLVLGTVGRIEPRKNQLALVEAFARLARSHAEVRLELVGPSADLDYAAAVAARVETLGLSSRVTLHGHVRDVARVISRWSLYVSLSSDEGQGLAVLEAMAQGVPVAALRVPGVEDYLRDGRTGFALATAAPAGVAARLEEIVRRPDILARVTRAASAMVARRFRWEHTVAKIDGIYAALLEQQA